jgi:hypothetical protein
LIGFVRSVLNCFAARVPSCFFALRPGLSTLNTTSSRSEEAKTRETYCRDPGRGINSSVLFLVFRSINHHLGSGGWSLKRISTRPDIERCWGMSSGAEKPTSISENTEQMNWFAWAESFLANWKVRDSEWSPHAKQVLELATQAALSLHHDAVGAEHLLAGMLKLNSGPAAAVLRGAGLTLPSLRQEMESERGISVKKGLSRGYGTRRGARASSREPKPKPGSAIRATFVSRSRTCSSNFYPRRKDSLPGYFANKRSM